MEAAAPDALSPDHDQPDPRVSELLLAAYLDQQERCVELIGEGVPIDAAATVDALAPYKRLRGGKKKQVRPLPSESPQLPLHRYAGRGALALAVEGGGLATVRRLIAHKAAVAAADSSGASAVDLALERVAVGGGAGAERERDAAIVAALEEAAAALPASGDDRPRKALTAQQAIDRRALREAAHMRRVQSREAARLDLAVKRGLADIKATYEPLHPHVHSPPGGSLLDVQEARLHAGVPGLAVVQLLEPSFASDVWEEMRHYEDRARQKGLPLHERFDGNVDKLECCGFAGLCERIHEAVAPLFPAIGLGDPPPRFLHAVRLDNYPGRPGADKLALKVHQDKYRLTINVCVFASPDVAGSTVGFYSDESGTASGGTQAAGGRGAPGEERREYTHAHRPGLAVVHSGFVWHKTDPIVRGRRGSLVLWGS